MIGRCISLFFLKSKMAVTKMFSLTLKKAFILKKKKLTLTFVVFVFKVSESRFMLETAILISFIGF